MGVGWLETVNQFPFTLVSLIV